MFFQVSVANVENAHHSTRQCFFLSELKKKVPRKRRTVPRKRRFLQATGPDHPEEYFGDKEPARNPQRQRKHIFLDAGCLSLCPCTKSGRAICHQHNETDHLLNDGDINIWYSMDDIELWRGVSIFANVAFIISILDIDMWQKMLDEATEPWGIKVERVEM